MPRTWLPLAVALLSLTGCAIEPAATLVTRPGAPFTAPSAQGPARSSAAALAAEPAIEEQEPEESDAAPAPEAVKVPGAETVPLRTAAYAESLRTDARGNALQATAVTNPDPIYLTPRTYPIILPGSPAPLPSFTPRPVDVSKLPRDAFVELDRLGRLRDRTRGRLAWIFGYSFPKISAATARTRLAAGQAVWLGPDGSHLHRDRAYSSVSEARTIEAMLEDLRRAALDEAARVAREANIEGRLAVLPGFNATFDIYKLWLYERVLDGYTYRGEPVRRGVATAAGLFEQRSLRRRVATYWEDHPGCTAGELRAVSATALLDRFEDIRRSASTYAANPSVYTDSQLIPYLRDPRPVVDGDRTLHDLDVRYNEEAIRAMCNTMPQVLRSALYP